MKAKLILENGPTFNGYAFGHIKDTVGEIVFTTGLTGYQETLTDPSFAGQIVCMTYPLIGNYGINLEDMEAEKPHLSGLVVRSKCDYPNNWRCEIKLEGFLKQNKIMAIEGIDTRALTRFLRNNGTTKAIIAIDNEELTEEYLKEKFDSYSNVDVISQVTSKEAYTIEGNGLHLAVIDFGIKRGILESLKKRGCKLTVFPAFSSVEEILKVNPDGIFLSNGPGDPYYIPQVIENIKELVNLRPVVGICLGHQLLSIAFGCKIERMKFGHHGGNHPVKNLETGRCYISSQNHEFVVSELSEEVMASWVNVNDNTLEGIRHKSLPVSSVQFHPEASPGPLDTGFIFDDFLKIIAEGGNKNA
ncbi:MAG: glutamine-hydrolyzing carbamoyl-phosphate synthase small subunit [Lachnospiraceae bacterium]|nr:glutamine-hydrolyzing carbamoyl-phosphate synthase small subunit [Lachnospiraceae bacterium]